MRLVHKQVMVSGAFVLAVASMAGIASAQVLVCEDFSYPNGSLVPNGGWAGHSGNAGDFMVTSGQAVVQHGVPSEDVNLVFAPVAGDVYYGLDFSVDNLGAPYVGADNEYFAHFREGFNFSARLDIVAPTGSGDYTVGIASDESTADVTWGTDLTFGTTYRAIVRYDQVNNIAQLWIDALLSTDPSITGEDRPDPGDTVVSIALRQSDSSENEIVRVDNLTVGLTFGDCLGTGSCTAGTQTARFAAMPNPGLLARGGQPNIGAVWDPTITIAGSVGDFLIVSALPDRGTVTIFGTILCTLPGSVVITSTTPGLPFSVGIPNNPAVHGATIYTQGVGIDASNIISLTNAIDLVIGG